MSSIPTSIPQYTPMYYGEDAAIQQEFERLAQFLNNSRGVTLPPTYYAEPEKGRLGQVVVADGSQWDPDSLAVGDPYLVWFTGLTWTAVDTAGGGGVTDHGALTGLSDPDHPIAAVSGLQTQLDTLDSLIDANATAIIGKNTVFWQATAPTAIKVSDIWVDTDDNQSYIWSGSAWVSIRDALILQNEIDAAQAIADAATAQATADGKIVTYYSDTDPTGAPDFITPSDGDLWFDTDSDNEVYRWNGSSWDSVQDAGIIQALADAATAQTTADGKIQTFIQTTAPVGGLGEGDIWFDSDDDNHPYRYNGSSWVDVRDQLVLTAAANAATAITNAATAQATADGKVATFYQASAPTAEGVGDLWVDTDDDRLYRWSGSAWVEIQDADIAAAISNAALAQATADGKIVTFYAASAPTAEGIGDIWFDTDDLDRPYRWNGSSWIDISWIGEIGADVTNNHTAGDTAAENGSFTTTLTGATGSPTGTIYWERTGSKVTLRCSSTISAAKASGTALFLSDIPAEIQPTAAQYSSFAGIIQGGLSCVGVVQVNASVVNLIKTIVSGGTVLAFPGTWTVGETCGVAAGLKITYTLD